MIRNVIVMGDATTHGGNVIHASSMIVVDGKNVALVGDLVSCPKCKGVYPIIEGTEKVFFMGQPAALEGMQTACGARLIASQNRMFVNDESNNMQTDMQMSQLTEEKALLLFDDYFQIVDSITHEPLKNTEYAFRRENGEVEYGVTDSNGYTHLLKATANSENIDIYVEG